MVESKHRRVVETGLTLLTQAAMSLAYWPYAFCTTIYLLNRLPTPINSFNSPCELLYSTTPNYSLLRVFLNVSVFLVFDHTIYTSYNLHLCHVFFLVMLLSKEDSGACVCQLIVAILVGM